MELFVGGSTVEELEVDGRVASVEAGRVAKLAIGAYGSNLQIPKVIHAAYFHFVRHLLLMQ